MESERSSDDVEDINYAKEGEELCSTPEKRAVSVNLEVLPKKFGS